jgi:hypothetical protein
MIFTIGNRLIARCLPKGRVLHCKTRPFIVQSTVFRSAKGRLLHWLMAAFRLRFVFLHPKFCFCFHYLLTLQTC